MATTIVPAYDGPIIHEMEEVRAAAREILVRFQGDQDKATEEVDEQYYAGGVEAMTEFLDWLTEEKPSLEEIVARSKNRSDTDPSWRTDYS